MSTRGFIGMHRKGETRVTYNHSDSYPSWLGEKMLQYVRRSDVAADGEKYFALPVVSEDVPPTPEQEADLKARGYWQNVSTGADWYSMLRDAQGDIEDQIEAGYLLTIDSSIVITHDIFMEYGYIIDLERKELVCYECDWKGHGAPLVMGRFTFDQIKAEDFDVAAAVAAMEPSNDDD